MSRVSIAAIAVAATVATGSSAFASSVHFFCLPTACGSNGANLISGTQTPNFGINITGGGSSISGTLYIDFLIPAGNPGFSATLTGPPSGTTGAALGTWTTSPPDLGVFQFGANGPKGNPISALGAGGPFTLYDIVFSGITLSGSGTTPNWTSTKLPLGAVLIGFFDEGSTGSCTSGTGTCDKTANSEALLITPLPGALSLFATGLLGLGLLGRRRKKIVNLSA